MSKNKSTKNIVEQTLHALLTEGQVVHTEQWQSKSVSTPQSNAHNQPAKLYSMLELTDVFIQMKMEYHTVDCEDFELAGATGADMIWAESHFIERISGRTNPGEQYKYWPYWTVDKRYMEGQIFSHTYQERFWPIRKSSGARYDQGDWNDICLRLCRDTSSRQVFLSIWHPEDQSNNGVRVPCSIGYWFKVTNNILSISYLIRSCDARRHFRNDVYMAQRLANEMLSNLYTWGHKDIVLGNMSMWIGSFHCFESDVYAIKKRLSC